MNHCKKILLTFLAAAASVVAMAQNTANLDLAVRRVRLNSAMRHATLSVCVYNITRDSTIYVFNAERSVTPASLNKLFTTSAGFEKLGKEFSFKTIIGYSGTLDNRGTLRGNVVIVGGGDPLLGSARYKQTVPDTVFKWWARALREEGIKRIEGHVSVDPSIFDDESAHPTWQWGDVGNYYGCGVSGLNFHENMYTVFFNAGDTEGAPAVITGTKPRDLGIEQTNKVTTCAANAENDVYIYGDPDLNMRLYRGTVPLGAREQGVRGSLPQPALVCGQQFTEYLRKHNVTVSEDAAVESSRDTKVRMLIDYLSNSYQNIAYYANLTSNNMYAESIFKYLGYWQDGVGSYASGSKMINNYFKDLGLDANGIYIVDGSGLSRENRITSSFLCKFLAKVSKKSYYEDLCKTLGIPGQLGTVKNMSIKLQDGASIRIKSGSMGGVKGYAGFYTDKNGTQYSFSIISNHHECDNAAITSMLKSIIEQVAKL